MRLWHYRLLPYLPENQFRGQLRELVAIMHDWRDRGSTNHLLINRVMEYPKDNLEQYFELYERLYKERYGKRLEKYLAEFRDFANDSAARNYKLFPGWHDDTYLRVCMANLYEKHIGVGSSKITDDEWDWLCYGYKSITGEKYTI